MSDETKTGLTLKQNIISENIVLNDYEKSTFIKSKIEDSNVEKTYFVSRM